MIAFVLLAIVISAFVLISVSARLREISRTLRRIAGALEWIAVSQDTPPRDRRRVAWKVGTPETED